MKAFIENGDFVEPELVQLAREISASANNLSWYLQSSGHPQPSSLIDTPSNVLPSYAPGNAHNLRQKLKQDALKLFRLASGPNEFVAHTALNVCLFPSPTNALG
jgi:6-hydroxytryprostatin B O-methyltransferase